MHENPVSYISQLPLYLPDSLSRVSATLVLTIQQVCEGLLCAWDHSMYEDAVVSRSTRASARRVSAFDAHGALLPGNGLPLRWQRSSKSPWRPGLCLAHLHTLQHPAQCLAKVNTYI